MGFCDEKTARDKLSSIDDQVEDKEFVSKLATGLRHAENCDRSKRSRVDERSGKSRGSGRN